MEQKLLLDFKQILTNETKISLKLFSIARSLIVNTSTSDQTISSIIQTLKTLSTATKTPQFYLLHVTTLLCEISVVRCHFASLITTILHSLSLHGPNISPRAAGLALTTLVSLAPALASTSDLVPAFSEMTEGLFLSLCFVPCVPVRQSLLLNAEKFDVRPSVLLTVLLGFTKDPYPYVRMAALDGFIGLCKCIAIEDRAMVEGCYLRAVELLLDTEECVRCSALHMVCDWGKLLVANSDDKSKRDWSDAIYVQICSMVRDMSMNVRIRAFNALSQVEMVSDYILMQTLSKKVLPITKEKKFPGQLTGKHFSFQASSAAGAFVHGLEDEFYEVRSCACYSLRMPAILSAEFAVGALSLLMDVLNDDSTTVRLQALETMHHMAVFGHLKVQEIHMHMFLGTLVDVNSSIRCRARKVVGLTKLHDLPMFKLVADSLLHSLQIYPQDEADVFSIIFDISRSHGNYAVSLAKEIFSEMEPCSETKWDLNSSKTASRLVLAIGATLSHEKLLHLDSITFSYAVTMLGRISRGLTHVMDQDTLLAYLSRCSRSTVEDRMVEDDAADCHLPQVRDIATNYAKLIFANISQLWPLTKVGCTTEVLMTLRGWKEELATYTRESDPVLTFTSRYLHTVKLLLKAWWHVMCPIRNDTCDSRYIFQKLDRRLRELRHRFTGLTQEEESHIQELILISRALRLESTRFHESALNKDGSMGIDNRELLEFFSLKQLPLHGKNLRFMEAQVDTGGNDWLNPLRFVAGLPVGIPLKIRLHNTPIETKLWLMMTSSKESSEYVFLDLKRFEGSDEMREFTFIAPFYKTLKVNYFKLRLSIGMECFSEEVHSLGRPKHELVYLCKEREVFLSMGGG